MPTLSRRGFLYGLAAVAVVLAKPPRRPREPLPGAYGDTYSDTYGEHP